MARILALLGIFLWLSAQPVLADNLPGTPFHVIYRHENVVPGEVTTKADLLITVINRSGLEARNVVVSATNPNPYYVINMPIPFEDIPAGTHKELLIHAEVPNDAAFADGENEEILWEMVYTSTSGEPVTVEIAGEKGN